MTKSYLLLGSNQGDREANIETAIFKMNTGAGPVVRRSSLYQTAAWGKEDQPDFLNLAVLIETPLTPTDLLHTLKSIEIETGRVPTEKWGPRVIDIDILFYGSEVFESPELTIPHPYMAQRRFTLMPLSEIAKDFIHPILKVDLEQLLWDCPDLLEVKKLEP